MPNNLLAVAGIDYPSRVQVIENFKLNNPGAVQLDEFRFWTSGDRVHNFFHSGEAAICESCGHWRRIHYQKRPPGDFNPYAHGYRGVYNDWIGNKHPDMKWGNNDG